MSLTAEQIAVRKKGIGGSECAMALGLSKRKTALQLYLEKRGEVDFTFEETEEIWWGRALEPIVRQKYAERTDRIVYLPPDTLWHPEHDFMCAHVDGVSTDRSGGDKRGYEGKTALQSIGWGEEGTDEMPIDYLMQNHHYIVVTGLDVFDTATLIGRRFAIYEVHRDQEMSEMIVEGERDFMRRVREGDPPPLDYQHKTALDVLKKLYPGTNGRRLSATQEAIAWRAAMQEHAEAEKAAKASKEAFRARLLELMGESALLAFPDGKVLRRQVTNRKGYAVDPTEFVDARFVNDPKPSFAAFPGQISK